MSIERLRAVPIFEKLSAAELISVESVATRETVPPGRVIFFEGDRSDCLYVVLSGSIKVFQTGEDGKERILTTLGSGAFVGEIAMLDGGPRSASVAALVPTELLVLRHSDFRASVKRNPEMLWKVLEAVCGQTRRGNDQLFELAFRDVPYRLLRQLRQLTTDHGVAVQGGIRIGIKLTAADLAGMVGATAERVSRLMQRFQNDRLIELDADDHIVVPDPHALERSLEYVKDWL